MFHTHTFSKATALVHGAAIATLVAGMSLAASSANAATVGAVPQVTIMSHNYDLSRNAGVAALYARIAQAAHEVCDAPDRPALSQQSRVNKCVNVAIKGAIENADIAALSAYYAAKKGSSNATSSTALTAGNVANASVRK